MTLRYVTQKISQAIDEELMSAAGGFSIDQLMELAGLSVAQAIAKVFSKEKYPRVLICCGPGNNGGDGLVAARHLAHFGYKPAIFYPKRSAKDLYQRLVTQCVNLNIPIMNDLVATLSQSDLIVDAIFGFSFKGDVRPPFLEAITALKETKLPIASVDIPSGWDVEKGNVDNQSFVPAMLISLTAPKLGTQGFKGIHYLGGRFIPPVFEEKYNLKLPPYDGTEQVVDITKMAGEKL